MEKMTTLTFPDGSTYEITDAEARRIVSQLSPVVGQNTDDINRLDSEIAVERARINNLANVPSGSTSGDAELIDGRLDFTGKVWGNIGEAIRGVTNNENYALSGLAENTVINKSVISAANTRVEFRNEGVKLHHIEGALPYVLFSSKVAVAYPNPRDCYYIIARCNNGVIVYNGQGQLYYISNDITVVKNLSADVHSGIYRFYLHNDSVVIMCNKIYRYNVQTLDQMLSAKGVNDTVINLTLGVSTTVTDNVIRYFVDIDKYNYDIRNALSYNAFNKGVIDSNMLYVLNDKGVYAQNNSNNLGYILLKDYYVMGDIIHDTLPQNGYIILAKCTDAFIILNSQGGLYYIGIDYSNGNIQYLGSIGLTYLPWKVYKVRNGVVIVGESPNYYSLDELNALLSAHNVNNVATEIVLGFACTGNTNNKFSFFANSIDTSLAGTTGNFIGDSLTAQNKYTNALSILFDYNVNNYGLSGTTITNIKPNNFITRVESMGECDFVFILGGTNDWGLNAQLGTPSDRTDDTFYGALYNLLTALRTKYKNKPIFISNIPQRNWISGGQASGMSANANGVSLETFNKAIEEMGRLFGCYVIDAFGESGITELNFDLYTTDNLHFNDNGGIRFATFLNDKFKLITKW